MSFDYDVIVVGSGFGGSVSALRLSQKGYRVLVVEAGKRWSKEDFPETNWQVGRYLWAPQLGARGIQRMQLMRHALVLSGVGVGGGSLVYGNTLFEPLDPFFEAPTIAALGGAAVLKPYFELARKMMGVVANPRITAMDGHARAVAEEYGRGDSFMPSPVAVYFGEEGQAAPDPYFEGEGPARTGCTACGGCFLGCRVGAKNTLDRNYLYLAEGLGCQIMAETKVERLVPIGGDGAGGYEVHVKVRGEGRRVMRAGQVVVSAGVMGTLSLLLEARQRGDLPRTSAMLGREVRTNSETVVAVRARARDADHSWGIAASTSVFPDDHTQIQIDRYPAGADALATIATLMVDGGKVPRWLGFVGQVLRHPLDFLRVLWPFGFARQTAFLVVMQDWDNKLRLKLGRSWLPPFGKTLRSKTPDGPAAPSYIAIGNDFARRLAKRIGGVPLSSVSEVLMDVPTTAHILGGCPIGETPQQGVVDLDQKVFGYENLYVVDGTVVPVNLGVNPALTILALAERAMAKVPTKPGAQWRGLAVDSKWGVEALLQRDGPQG